jgi:hypothetical protein
MSCQSLAGNSWPDGKALIAQPVRLREAFDLIGSVDAKCKKKGKP